MVEEEREPIGSGSPWPLIVLFGLIFLPGGILAAIEWGMLRYGRHRPSVIGAVAFTVGTLAFIVGIFFIQSTIDTIAAGGLFEDPLGTLGSLVPIWVCLSLVLGAPVGHAFAIYSARQMKKNPYLTQLAGDWRFNFTYRRTPVEYFRRRKNIQRLRNALLIEDEKAPMGLDEKTDEVVFRYDTEARKHTFMTGASGSGKALHALTWIPTQRGFVRVSRVRVGDTLFDDSGNPTKVLAVYQPKTPDHYEIRFSNGELVRACGDHLWPVKVAGGSMKTEVVATREIAREPGKYYISSLKKPALGVEKPMVNTRLLGAWLASGALDNGHILKRDTLTGELQQDYDSFIDDLVRGGWLKEDGTFKAIDHDYVLSSIPARERILEGAITVAGSVTFDGQTKLTLHTKETAEFLHSLVFSLGIQASPLERVGGGFVFRFAHSRAMRRKDSTFASSIGELMRKKAPKRNLIKFESIVAIDDNPDDYFCFTVDSPNHVFLFGKSFTPTHNTITMQNLIYADIESGKDVVVIDFKRSPKFASKLAAWAEDHGREFYHFVNGDPEDYDIPRSKGQCYYDPLKSGTPTSKADMVLGMREYDSAAAVYKAGMQQLLQVLFGMLKFAHRKSAPGIQWDSGGIYQLYSALGGNNFMDLTKANSVEIPQSMIDKGYKGFPLEIPGGSGLEGSRMAIVNSPIAKQALELAEELRGKTQISHARGELMGQLRTIIASEYGRWMKIGGPGDREIDLYELTTSGKTRGNVILFSLNSDSEPQFAQYVGAMIFSDLTNISALRRNVSASNQINIYVDEFQAVPPSAVTSLLEKSRESKMAMTIAQQSFDQVVASAESAGEAYLNSILDTCSNFIAHAGSTEKSATRLAEILGKEYVTVYSRMNENDSSFLSVNWAKSKSSKVSSREEERWKFPPSEFMSLASPDPGNNFKSSAVWITKTSSDPHYSSRGGATARSVWMVPAETVLVEYYDGAEKPVKQTSEERALVLADLDEAAASPFEETRKTTAVPAPLQTAETVRADADVEDDDWNFQDIPDEELDAEPADEAPLETPYSQESDVSSLFSSAPQTVTEPKRAPVTPVVSEPKPQIQSDLPALPKVLPQTPSLPARPQGLPSRPGTGLPSRPGGGLPSLPSPSQEKNDSKPSALPGL